MPPLTNQYKAGTDVVRIPKLSFWDLEREVFDNLEEFLYLTSHLDRPRKKNGFHDPPIDVLRALLGVTKYQIAPLNELFYLLRDAAFSFSTSEWKQHQPKPSLKLFEDEQLTDWRWQKARMKKNIKTHEKHYQTLRDLHENCLKSQEADEKTRKLLDSALEQLVNSNLHGSQCDKQVQRIQRLSKRMERVTVRFFTDHHDYTKKLRKEKEWRYRITAIGWPMEFEIVSCLRSKISKALAVIDRICPGFDNLEEFLYLTSHLGRPRKKNGFHDPPIDVLRALLGVTKYQIAPLNELFYLLRDAAFSFSTSEWKQHQPKPSLKLFEDEQLTDWRWQKARMKKNIKTHEKHYQALRDLHANCLKSQEADEKTRKLLDSALEQLVNSNLHGSQFDKQVQRIQRLSKRMKRVTVRLFTDHHDYAKKLKKEKEWRYRITAIGWPMEFEIVSCLRSKITKALAVIDRICPGLCHLTSKDIALFSDYLYDITSKKYVWWNARSDICSAEFKQTLPRSQIQPSKVPFGNEDETYASHNMTAIVQNDTKETNGYFLKLQKGDEVRLRLVSRDWTVGFGWHKDAWFSFKRWGFFRINNLELRSESY